MKSPVQGSFWCLQVIYGGVQQATCTMINDRWAIFRTSMSKFVENSELARNRFKHLQNVVDCNVLNL
jgi:hypothetical protein